MPSTHREDASPPQTVPEYQRSESLPATPSDAMRTNQVPPAMPLQYRYPAAPGYWPPMSYDMRLWTGLQMHQYMMDPRHSDHGTTGQCSTFF